VVPSIVASQRLRGIVAAESTATIMAAPWSVRDPRGPPQALYSDRASWAFYAPKAGQPVATDVPSQVE
jgi:hypothetical protein